MIPNVGRTSHSFGVGESLGLRNVGSGLFSRPASAFPHCRNLDARPARPVRRLIANFSAARAAPPTAPSDHPDGRRVVVSDTVVLQEAGQSNLSSSGQSLRLSIDVTKLTLLATTSVIHYRWIILGWSASWMPRLVRYRLRRRGFVKALGGTAAAILLTRGTDAASRRGPPTVTAELSHRSRKPRRLLTTPIELAGAGSRMLLPYSANLVVERSSGVTRCSRTLKESSRRQDQRMHPSPAGTRSVDLSRRFSGNNRRWNAMLIKAERAALFADRATSVSSRKF